MPGLPDVDFAVIEESKITHYLLAADHPVGRFKAAFFLGFGFGAAAWEELHDALLAHARDGQIVSVSETEFGIKYILEGPLSAPDGRRPNLRAVWFVEAGERTPRLVTAYAMPRGGE
ncbi:MAG TPA: hypothetical protein VN808_11870 [Stellaceae bacterium]|nr:hypothetical protein [Stellaceae bacterium]